MTRAFMDLTERQAALMMVALAPPPPDLVAGHPIGHRMTYPGDRAKANRTWRRAALTYVRAYQIEAQET